MTSMGRLATAMAGALAVAALAASPVAAKGSAQSLGREVVAFDGGLSAGTIVVRTTERRLYYVIGDGRAIRYPIAVGMPGKEWAGATTVGRMEVNPIWGPPAEVKRDKPNLPDLVPPGPHNPLGPRAMLLSGTEYAIHGTNRRDSIGTRASYGCIRMFNEDVVDLYDKVRIGTPVVVTR
ncbi:L,D-transpeptidase [Siculibacillus lacustris]|uniref:L,D-transpeptidase n=1 Tax=Siculibacillus lacustris TaxID=1549641 RepID=A0A4Q9VY39_9HYPH|nr:L,D-transpeptidase [Siculibacillus lacustris]TBW40102.1 L,D-transpeptidase [Siculibacillus lacustris]